MRRSALVSLVLALVGSGPSLAADISTTINAGSDWGTWDGWGVSLAWWAAAFGSRDDLADIFFSVKSTTLGTQSLPGLGFTIARYNAGACSWNTVNGKAMVVASTMNPTRQIDAFWLNWDSTTPSSSSWNWTADANQRAMLAKAKARGADKFELFSNSPVWWMCKNHNPAGSDDGTSDNLQNWNYDQHAVYLATVAEYAAANWGIKFASVDPFNEPSAGWWKGPSGSQEGCHFDVSTQAAVIPHLRSELDRRGLTSTIVSASDENSYDAAVSTFKTLQGLYPPALADVGRINVHGYQQGGGQRDVLYNLTSAAKKGLWNSEYGENDATGKALASNLILDFRWLKPTAWVYWQAIDGGGWGLIDGDNSAKTIGAPSQKYFVLAQFARHIRPGMRILDGGSDFTVAAYDAATKTLVVVAVNWGDARYLNFDLSKFRTPGVDGALVKRWATQIGTSGQQYQAYSDTHINGKKFWSHFDQNVIMTFEVIGVVL